jgi:hypothetical protein
MGFRISDHYGAKDSPVDWKALKREIVERLDVSAEYAALGLEFTGHVRTTGWRECRAFGRKDRRPSAAVNVLTGYYKASGEDPEILSLFDFALKYGEFQDWAETIEHFAARAGVPMPTAPSDRDGKRVEAIYSYSDSAGDERYQVVRYREASGKKTFRIRRPDGEGWAWSLGDVEPIPYNLASITHSDPDSPVWIVEGEKDADRLAELGQVATCNHGGTGQTTLWERFAPYVRDRDLYIVPDNDPAGRDHALKVAGYVFPHARMVKVVDLPGLPAKGDASDFLDLGHTFEDLDRIAKTCVPWSPEQAEADAELDLDATAADLIRLDAKVSWAWKGWIVKAHLNVLASEPGIGKTRMVLDLARRVALGLPWPDGTPQTFPAGSSTLWVPADNQHSELASLPESFGFPPELLYLNATRRNPFIGTMLDSDEDLRDFEARIARIKPALVIVDTAANATDRSQHKPEDAKAFFKPLQEIAKRTGACFILVAHLNAAGKPLGRRIEGQARVVMMLERPDPEGQPNRRKFYVRKSFDMLPAPLGVTMHDRGNDYDTSPPDPAPEGEGRGNGNGAGANHSKILRCQEWLYAILDAEGSVRVSEIRRRAEAESYQTGTLYKAKDRLNVNEFELDGKKFWQLMPDEDGAF